MGFLDRFRSKSSHDAEDDVARATVRVYTDAELRSMPIEELLSAELTDEQSAHVLRRLEREELGNREPSAPGQPCPCCGYLTIDEPGTYEICRVCWWEDDPTMSDDPESTFGANSVSLREARANFAAYGASAPDCLTFVRDPLPHERPSSE